jgi:hypothetical protein
MPPEPVPAPASSFVLFVRGPPAAGKSTAAQALALRLRAGGARVALLAEDTFRYAIAGGGATTHAVAAAMLLGAARGALAEGHGVVVEGLLSAERYAPSRLLEAEDFAAESARVVFVFVSVELAAAQARHAARPKAAEFSAEDLARWFGNSRPLGRAGELVVPAGSSLEDTVEALAAAVGFGAAERASRDADM